MVGFDGCAVLHLTDGKVDGAGKQVGQCALMGGRQVLNQHNSHAQVCTRVLKQLSEGFQAPGRCSDADNRKVLIMAARDYLFIAARRGLLFRGTYFPFH